MSPRLIPRPHTPRASRLGLVSVSSRFRLGGLRIILRGPNGAGKSTLLKALSGSLPVQAGSRPTDERLRLGVFAQDLAQELPQKELALTYVAAQVREFDPSVTEERCRSVMGSLGLVGEKSIRRIGSLSGGEKARVALATFCLTPYNVLLLDEPTNHLDVDAIAALLDALETYEGAIVVISHDRPFCEALRATHVGYVCGGTSVVEERELRDADFSEADRGVRNTFVAPAEGTSAAEAGPPPPPPLGPEEAKAQRAAERSAQKLQNSAPKKLARVEAAIAEADQSLEALDAEMLSAGADVGRLAELSQQRDALQGQVDSLYAEMAELEAQKEQAQAMLENALNFGLRSSPTPPPPPVAAPPPPPVRAPSPPRPKENLSRSGRVKKVKKLKKLKVGKKEREEYATIEADLEALEIAAAKAKADLEEASAAKRRPPQMELLALAAAATDARRAADDKMERYMLLEELISEADEES